MRVFRHWQWLLGAGLLLAPAWAGCSLNPQPLPPELANDSGSTSYGDDAAGNAPDAGGIMDATKGVDADANIDAPMDAPIEAGEAGDASSDASEEGD